MKKEELIIRISELETKLKEEKLKIDKILSISTKLIKWRYENIYSYLNTDIPSGNIETLQELFFEIWKLIEFRDNILSDKEYERNFKNQTR